MTARLSGKQALITGAAQGLGAAIAAMLADQGARVALADINDAGAQAQADAINARHGAGTAFAFHLDVTKVDDWAIVAQQAHAAMGGLSVLVNNAGIAPLGSVEDLSLDTWHAAMHVNVDSVFHGCRAVLPFMRDHQPGSIINIASISALIASHNLAAYNASKAAVWMLTKSIALHCAREGLDIRCNSVHPTFIRTPLLDGFSVGRDTKEVEAKLARQVPLGRIGEPSDVGHAVIYLASDESRMMTGAELKLDGGMSAM
jgi:NAD(P)-dependent dehydrogenase (short-subunit alcohol dehydrogenase family)